MIKIQGCHVAGKHQRELNIIFVREQIMTRQEAEIMICERSQKRPYHGFVISRCVERRYKKSEPSTKCLRIKGDFFDL